MGLELARAFVRIRGDASSLTPDLEQARGEVENWLKSVGAGITTVLGGFVAKTGGYLAQGMAAAQSFEQRQISFKTLLGGAKEAEDMLQKLTEFAVKTPYEMSQIAPAATGLIQFGERGQDVIDTLTMLGNAASATNVPFDMLTSIFNQVRGAGKMLTQDFRQLSTRGVISLQDIADHFKVTTVEAEKMVSSGKVSFEDLRKIIQGLNAEGGRFHNMMEDQATTLEGLKSTYSDAFGTMLRVMSSQIIPAVKMWLNIKIALVNKMQELVQMFPAFTAGAFAGANAFAKLGLAIAGVVFVMKKLQLSSKYLLLGGAIGVGILALGAIFGILVARLAPVIKSWLVASGALEKLKAKAVELSTALLHRLSDALEMAKDKARQVFSYMTDLFDRFKGPMLAVFAKIKDTITEVWQPVQSVLVALVGPLMEATQGFAKLIATKVGILAVQAAIKGVLALITAIVIPLAFVGAKFILMGKIAQMVFDLIGGVLKEYGTDFATVAQTVVRVAVDTWNWVVGVVSSAITAIKGFLEENKETFARIWTSIKEIVSNAVRTMIALFNNLMEIGSFVVEKIGQLFNWMFGTNLQTAGDFFSFVFEKIAEFLDWVSLMSTNWGLTWELMKTNTAYVLLTIADKGVMLWNTLIAGAIGAGKGIFAALSAAAYNIGLTFQTVVASVKGMFKGLWEGIKNKFKGKSFLEGYKEAYNREQEKVKGEYKNMGDEASKAFNETFVENMGADSPFKAELEDLAQQAERIKAQMEAERDAKRKAREQEKEPGRNLIFEDFQNDVADLMKNGISFDKDTKKKLEDKKTKEEEGKGKTSPFDQLGQGRFGFADIGTKLQDILLKGEKDQLDKERNGMMEAGLKKQDELIKTVKESGGKPATLA